jgi:DNA repair exonuclease SbcCD ATPase subunit
MDIKALDIHNFCAIGDAHLELDNRGLILVQGVNADDSSAKSNGAGKSSIVDALCWCLYGTTARGESGDAIVNSKAKKDCAVKVLLEDGGITYQIWRFRKHNVHKNALFVHQIDASGTSTPLHKGTERETQEVIAKVMGCSLEVFKGSVYAGQEQMPDLPGMTDKFLKLLVEEAAGVEELAAAYAEAGKQATAVEKNLAVAYNERDHLQIQLDAARDTLANYQDQAKEFEAGRKGRAAAEVGNVPALTANANDLQVKIAAIAALPLGRRKLDLEAQIAGVKGEQDELERLQRALGKAHMHDAVASSDARNAKMNYDDAKQALAYVADKVGTACSECGKPYSEHDLDGLREHRAKHLKAIEANLRYFVGIARTAKAEVAAAQKALDDHKATMTDVSAATAELADINHQLGERADLERLHKRHLEAIAAAKANAKAKLTEPNPWTPHLPAREKAVKDLEGKLNLAISAVAALEARHALLKDACAVFGPAGVRAHILDTVTPFLNHQTGEYLGALADGNLHATWSTLTANAKGELKEKFSIAVANDTGGASFGLQSGGEKRKVRIATALALQDLVASRASKPINIFIADEVDHALDESGLERLMGVLDRKAKERGTVLVISHNSLSDWIDQTVTVTKSGGKSTVTGATVATF